MTMGFATKHDEGERPKLPSGPTVNGFYRVVTGMGTYGIWVHGGKIHDAGAMARWAIGKQASMFFNWIAEKGGTIGRIGN